jgi:hypothetical protein
VASASAIYTGLTSQTGERTILQRAQTLGPGGQPSDRDDRKDARPGMRLILTNVPKSSRASCQEAKR